MFNSKPRASNLHGGDREAESINKRPSRNALMLTSLSNVDHSFSYQAGLQKGKERREASERDLRATLAMDEREIGLTINTNH